MLEEVKRECIICKEQKIITDFNKEHIIPEAMGNTKITTFKVCKKCNSLLGEKIDCGLTNYPPSQFYRFINEIKGKKGEIPNPFSKGTTDTGEIIIADSDFNFSFPKVTINLDDKNQKIFVSGSNINEMINAINNKLKRMGRSKLSCDEIENLKENSMTKEFNPKIFYEYKSNCTKLKMAFLKITYEFGCEYIGNSYMSDPIAQAIRKIIYDYIYKDIEPSDLEKYVELMPQDENEKIHSLFKILKEETKSKYIHSIITLKDEDRIALSICIDDLHIYIVKFMENNQGIHKQIVVCYPSDEFFKVEVKDET